MMRESTNHNQVKRVLSPVSGAGDNTAQTGQIIDHQGYDAALYVILLGAIADADATFATVLEEGDQANLSDAATVADADMVTQTVGTVPLTAASFQFDSDDTVRKVGYKGKKRYTRLKITPTNNTGAWLVAATCLLSRAERHPVVQASA